MKGTPTKGKRLGGSAKHQRLMLANLVSSLMAGERNETKGAKAQALSPVGREVVTIRTSAIVAIIGGRSGTLGELAIA